MLQTLLFGAVFGGDLDTRTKVAFELLYSADAFYQQFKIKHGSMLRTATAYDDGEVCVKEEGPVDVSRRVYDEGYIHLFKPSEDAILATWSPLLECYTVRPNECGEFLVGACAENRPGSPWTEPIDDRGNMFPDSSADYLEMQIAIQRVHSKVHEELGLLSIAATSNEDWVGISLGLAVDSVRDIIFVGSDYPTLRTVLSARLTNFESTLTSTGGMHDKLQHLANTVRTVVNKLAAPVENAGDADACHLLELTTKVTDIKDMLNEVDGWNYNDQFFLFVEMGLEVVSVALEAASVCAIAVFQDRITRDGTSALPPEQLFNLRGAVSGLFEEIGKQGCLSKRFESWNGVLHGITTDYRQVLSAHFCRSLDTATRSVHLEYEPTTTSTSYPFSVDNPDLIQGKDSLSFSPKFAGFAERKQTSAPLGFAPSDTVLKLEKAPGNDPDIIRAQAATVYNRSKIWEDRKAAVEVECGPLNYNCHLLSMLTVCGMASNLSPTYWCATSIEAADDGSGPGCCVWGEYHFFSVNLGFYSPDGSKDCLLRCNMLNNVSFTFNYTELFASWTFLPLRMEIFYVYVPITQRITPNCKYLVVSPEHYSEPDILYGGYLPLPNGYYSPICDNDKYKCAIEYFQGKMTRFTSPSFDGTETGCEVKLTFVASLEEPPLDLQCPFTIEFWVRMDQVPEHAIIFGLFPRMYVSLGSVGSNARIGLFHANLTFVQYVSTDSVLYSELFRWTNTWTHLAIICNTALSSAFNISFYRDGMAISSSLRGYVNRAIKNIPTEYMDTWHFGPVNRKTFLMPNGKLYVDDNNEWLPPYFDDIPTGAFEAEIDEVRVHTSALPVLSLGYRLTKTTRSYQCELMHEKRAGNLCSPRMYLLSDNTDTSGLQCAEGFEIVAAFPHACVPKCMYGALRQQNGLCDCPLDSYQTWYTDYIRLTGDGDAESIIIYDQDFAVISATDSVKNLAAGYAVEFGMAKKVSVIELVPGNGMTRLQTLKIRSARSHMDHEIPEYNDYAVSGKTFLHHRSPSVFFDDSLSCALCQFDGSSTRPRQDVLTCNCLTDYGRNELGKCVPKENQCESPIMVPSKRYLLPGDIIYVTPATGSLCTEVRHTIDGSNPNCARLVENPSDLVPEEGLDLIASESTNATVKAIACNDLMFNSAHVTHWFHGARVLTAPGCNITGTLSTPTTYALNVTLTLTNRDQYGPDIKYSLDGETTQDYFSSTVMVTESTTIYAWVEKDGSYPSLNETCIVDIDEPSSAVGEITWVRPELGGYSYDMQAWLVKLPHPQEIQFTFRYDNINGVLDYRIKRVAQSASDDTAELLIDWTMDNGDNAHAATWPLGENSTTIVSVEWHIKLPGYVHSDIQRSRIMFVTTKASTPLIQMAPLGERGRLDHWSPDTLVRTIARQQPHVVNITHAVPGSSKVYFFLGTVPFDSTTLLSMNPTNHSSFSGKGIQYGFEWKEQRTTAREDLALACGSDLPVNSIRWCLYTTPFEAHVPDTVTAFAVVPGLLASPLVVLPVPQNILPDKDDPSLQKVPIVLEGTVLVANSNTHILPLGSNQATFSIESSSLDSDVLEYSVDSAPLDELSPPDMFQGEWLTYTAPMTLDFPIDANTGIWVGITVLKPGFLRSMPTYTHFVVMNKRSPVPDILVVDVVPRQVVLFSKNDAALSGSAYTVFYNNEHVIPIEEDTAWYTLRPTPTAVDKALRPSLEFNNTIGTACAGDADPVVRCATDISLGFALQPINALGGYVCAWMVRNGLRESKRKCASVETSMHEIVVTLPVIDQSCDEVSRNIVVDLSSPEAWSMQVRWGVSAASGIRWVDWADVVWTCSGSQCHAAVAVSFMRTNSRQLFKIENRVRIGTLRFAQSQLLQEVLVNGCTKPPQFSIDKRDVLLETSPGATIFLAPTCNHLNSTHIASTVLSNRWPSCFADACQFDGPMVRLVELPFGMFTFCVSIHEPDATPFDPTEGNLLIVPPYNIQQVLKFNLNYTEITSDVTKRDGLIGAVKRAVATECEVPDDTVNVTLARGSVIVRVEVASAVKEPAIVDSVTREVKATLKALGMPVPEHMLGDPPLEVEPEVKEPTSLIEIAIVSSVIFLAFFGWMLHVVKCRNASVKEWKELLQTRKASCAFCEESSANETMVELGSAKKVRAHCCWNCAEHVQQYAEENAHRKSLLPKTSWLSKSLGVQSQKESGCCRKRRPRQDSTIHRSQAPDKHVAIIESQQIFDECSNVHGTEDPAGSVALPLDDAPHDEELELPLSENSSGKIEVRSENEETAERQVSTLSGLRVMDPIEDDETVEPTPTAPSRVDKMDTRGTQPRGENWSTPETVADDFDHRQNEDQRSVRKRRSQEEQSFDTFPLVDKDNRILSDDWEPNAGRRLQSRGPDETSPKGDIRQPRRRREKREMTLNDIAAWDPVEDRKKRNERRGASSSRSRAKAGDDRSRSDGRNELYRDRDRASRRVRSDVDEERVVDYEEYRYDDYRR